MGRKAPVVPGSASGRALVRAVVAVAPVAWLLVSGGACQERASLVDRGGECFLATDCQPGLVCVDQGNGIRTCTDDLSEVAGDPPPDGSMPVERDASDEETPDAPPGDVVQPPQDSGQDTGTPVDAGDDG